MRQRERYQTIGKLSPICKRISLAQSKAQDPRLPSQLLRWELPNKEIKEHWMIMMIFQIHQLTRVELHILSSKCVNI